jgi:hypothetical protein
MYPPKVGFLDIFFEISHYGTDLYQKTPVFSIYEGGHLLRWAVNQILLHINLYLNFPIKCRGCFNKLSNDEEHIFKGESEPKPKPKSQPEQEELDKTDKYIVLLRDGLIGKEDFIKLISSNNKQDDISSIYQ